MNSCRPAFLQATRLTTRFVIPLALAIATFFSASYAQAQRAVDFREAVPPNCHLVMVNDDGSLHFIMTTITESDFLGLQVFTSWGTDLQTVQFTVIIPTTTPGGFGYIVANDPDADPNGAAGSAGSILVTEDDQGKININWQDNKGNSGYAFVVKT